MKRIAIVGAGFCGSVAAIHFLRHAGARVASDAGGLHVVLVNRPGTVAGSVGNIARGLAYGTPSAEHLLNVPAGRMSAFADSPDDFVRFLRENGVQADPAGFVARSLYGRYLADALSRANAAASRLGNRLDVLRDEVIEVMDAPDGCRITMRASGTQQFDAVILALGNFAPRTPSGIGDAAAASPRYVADPWAAGAIDRLQPFLSRGSVGDHQEVLLIGTGLTMFDVALSLATRHHESTPRLLAISRRGLLPNSHRASGAHADYASPPTGIAQASVRKLLRVLRRAAAEATAAGGDWRDVVASLRPITPQLWHGLPAAERARFMRHLRPYWEVHRHRCAPQVAERIGALRESGVLRTAAARLLRLEDEGDALVAEVVPRGGSPRLYRFAAAINCTGPSDDLAAEPLLRNLVDQGLASADPNHLGLVVDEAYRLRGKAGTSSSRIHYVGPLLKSMHWEATAVPELRTHVAAAVASVLRSLAP